MVARTGGTRIRGTSTRWRCSDTVMPGPWDRTARLRAHHHRLDTHFASGASALSSKMCWMFTNFAECRGLYRRDAESAEKSPVILCGSKDGHENRNENCFAGCGCARIFVLRRRLGGANRGLGEWH